jgi:hypothetical protein
MKEIILLLPLIRLFIPHVYAISPYDMGHRDGMTAAGKLIDVCKKSAASLNDDGTYGPNCKD